MSLVARSSAAAASTIIGSSAARSSSDGDERQRSSSALRSARPLVQPGLGQRRGHVADQGRARAALGDQALGRIVGGVEIDVGQVADQPLGPAIARQAGLLAGHEFERAMGAEMEHRVGGKILAQPAVESAERMGRGEAALEQQAHRIAFVAERRLDADEDACRTARRGRGSCRRRSAACRAPGPIAPRSARDAVRGGHGRRR